MNKQILGRIAMLAFLLAIGIAMTGCNDSQPPKPDPTNPANPANAISTGQAEEVAASTNLPPPNVNQAGVVNYGNGVYYFPYTKAAFGNALSVFLLNHKDMEVSAIACDIIRMEDEEPATPGRADFDWGGVNGYFVTFREKK
jgi:hypothetical protein